MRISLLFFGIVSSAVLLGQAANRVTPGEDDRSDKKGFLSFLKQAPKAERHYRVQPAWEIPAAALGGILGQERLKFLQDKSEVSTERLAGLTPDRVPGFDRIALRLDPDKHKDGLLVSDYFFNTGQWLPFGLFIWKKYRREWLDISTMYLQAQATQGLFYGFAPFGPTQTNRLRPNAYYEAFPLEDRMDGNTRNSMFSGHVSTTATGFFFAAKILDDFNPQFTGTQRFLLYAGATVPGVITGAMRVKGLKHFPSDSLVGLGVGAVSGIGIPALHRWWKARHERSDLTALPYLTPSGGAGGLGMHLTF